MEIRIHPVSSNRITDQGAAHILQKETPTAFRKSQDVIVAAKKMLQPETLFSSKKKRLKVLQTECYALCEALKADGYRSDQLVGFVSKQHGDVVADYLSQFSDAFPNWQNEYEHLNKMLPLIFS